MSALLTQWNLDGPSTAEEPGTVLDKLKRGKASGRSGIREGVELSDRLLVLM